MHDSAPPPSPCVNVCQLDAGGRCLGCGRTAAQIACWPAATPAAKQAILAELHSRTVACSRCERRFVCGARSGQPCWCMSLPPVSAPSGATDCVCPDCLVTR